MYHEHQFERPPSENQPPAGRARGETAGIIFDVKRYAVHDGPGIRTTVFLKGCSLRCLWCHNPESWQQMPEPSLRTSRCRACGRCVDRCPRGAITCPDNVPLTDPHRCVVCGECLEACPTGAREIIGRKVRVADLIEQLERDVLFYDESGGGVTLSGGEPLMQSDFTADLLAECRQRHLHTALDTTCHAPWHVIESLLNSVDLFLCDLKCIDSAGHQRLTGVPNELILENIRRLARRGKAILLRVPVVPGLTDSDENITAIGRFANQLGGIDRLDLLPYNEAMLAKAARLARSYEIWRAKTPSRTRMEQLAARLSQFGLHVKIDG